MRYRHNVARNGMRHSAFVKVVRAIFLHLFWAATIHNYLKTLR